MIKVLRLSLFISIISLLITCKERYDPPAISNAGNFLVVEGVININATTTIKLSRTAQLQDTSKVLPESNAILNIEDEANNKYFLLQQIPGTYTLPASGLSAGKKYRLRIKTRASFEYLSEYVEAIETPQIDSISYKVQNNGVQFYANTHDAQNKTRYYRWEYDETWKYISVLFSSAQYSNSLIEYRPLINMIYFCYQNGISNNINIGSSANLVNDVITDGPVAFIPAHSGKLAYGYNIQIKQYALTEDAYKYWQNLKKNTEQLGTIFDAQPSIASGNIHCETNPEEPVIGYLSASSVTSKRFHFFNKDLPVHSPSYIGPPSISSCLTQEIFFNPVSTYSSRVKEIFSSGRYIPTEPISDAMQGTIGYKYAAIDCVDCRVKGGSTVKPSYWP